MSVHETSVCLCGICFSLFVLFCFSVDDIFCIFSLSVFLSFILFFCHSFFLCACLCVCVCVCVCVCESWGVVGERCLPTCELTLLKIVFVTPLIKTGRLETHIDTADDCIRLARQCQLHSLVSLIEGTLKKTLDFRKLSVFFLTEGVCPLCICSFCLFHLYVFLSLCVCERERESVCV